MGNLAIKSKIVEELSNLGKGALLTAKLPAADGAGISDIVEIYIALNTLQKIIAARLSDIKPLLHEVAEQNGDLTEKGSLQLYVGENRVIREKRESTAPDEEKLRALLETRGVDLDAVFDTIQTYILNPSKLQYIIDTGRIDKNEVVSLKETNWAIKAEPGPELAEVCALALAVEAPKPSRKPRRK